ncbi:hypothetical protein Poly24_48800 [Rosistilla carotiformis]|uniref:Uncharacterized protein n=1 Tax=Rosistilla carotiformis TaxID=2528017 RepID=A0A518K026_9BACT|nr:hypothetical protein [Rosistilla carotiformis]QDV71146.1 hypothetical protein Poly24_48800 [Rosistilla carotiformis]
MSTRVGDLATHFQSATTESNQSFVVGVAMGILVPAVGIGYLVYRKFYPSEGELCSHNKLFDGLCQVHGLAKTDRRLLLRIAEEMEIEQAALLFTNPTLLRTASRKQIAASRDRILQLHRVLFD